MSLERRRHCLPERTDHRLRSGSADQVIPKPRVPEEGTGWVHDQEGRRDHVGLLDFGSREPKARGLLDRQDAAVEYIEAYARPLRGGLPIHAGRDRVGGGDRREDHQPCETFSHGTSCDDLTGRTEVIVCELTVSAAWDRSRGDGERHRPVRPLVASPVSRCRRGPAARTATNAPRRRTARS
ncbi:MAG: hypothetical protein DMF90_01065 [Acidobacteria bacterium]|nr:MAG: hypothetical protein DMF90_01065 [Acidobacteriota bacterium]